MGIQIVEMIHHQGDRPNNKATGLLNHQQPIIGE